MKTLTKDQVQNLTPEQQDAVAMMEIRLVQKRERLLTQARGSGYFSIATGAMLAIAYLAGAFLRAPLMLQMGFFVLSMAIMTQSIATNQRLNAMMELFDADHDACGSRRSQPP